MKLRISLGWACLTLLTAAGLISAYEVAFSMWMTAYPFANIHYWRPHFYLRLAQTGLVVVCWMVNAVWLWRRRRDAGWNKQPE